MHNSSVLLTQFPWIIFFKKHCSYHMPRNGRSEICLTQNWCSLGLLLWKTEFLAGREPQQPGRSRGRPGWGGGTCFFSCLGWRQVGCWAGYEGGSQRERLHFMSLRRSRRKIRWKLVRWRWKEWFEDTSEVSVKPKVPDKYWNVSAALNILLFAFSGAVIQIMTFELNSSKVSAGWTDQFGTTELFLWYVMFK